MNEVWKDIRGYEGLYQVSSLGNVRSLNRVNTNNRCIKRELKGRILKQSDDGKGYLTVSLSRNNKTVSRTVHSLVASNFIQKTRATTQVNHISGVKNDNRVINLEWVTASENLLHAHKIGIKKPLLGNEHQGSVLTESDVIWLRKNKGKFRTDDKAKELSVSCTTIRDAISGRTWSWLKEGLDVISD